MRDTATTRGWADQGTQLFSKALARIADKQLAGATVLPGWTGRHLVAHVAANAEALLNLTHWAATGEETPMYSSPTQRNADIEAGADRSPTELRRWTDESAAALDAALSALTGEQWSRSVRTAQGRTVPATEIPWLRAREVMVHAVDLDPSLSFDGLPPAFLLALADDIVAKRSGGKHAALTLLAPDSGRTWSVLGSGQPTQLSGSVAGVAAYLAGRPGPALTSESGAVPHLPPWL